MVTDAEGTNKIHLEIVTPRGRALSVIADEVTAPSTTGEFGVMPGHLPLLAALRTGLVTYKEKGTMTRVAVGAGFAEAGANKVVILTDEYIERDKIDPVLVRKELSEVQADIGKAATRALPGGEAVDLQTEKESSALKLLVARENWLAAQLELYGDPPAAVMRPFEEYGPPPPPDDDDIPEEDPPAKG